MDEVDGKQKLSQCLSVCQIWEALIIVTTDSQHGIMLSLQPS